MRDRFIVRLRIVLGVVLFVFVVIIVRLYFVQVVDGSEYSRRADRQYVQPQESLFGRGSIFFEDKNGARTEAATLRSGFTLAINPQVLNNPEKVFEDIAEITTLDRENFFIRASKRDDPYEVVANRLTRAEADEVQALGIEGVIAHEERWRYYPGESLSAQTLGFVGFDGDRLKGRYGLERYYDDVLVRDDDSVYVNFFAEVFSNIDGIFDSESRRAEGNIVTTIDPTVQAFLERELENVVSDWNADTASGIVIDPNTGEVYALAAYPTFDLNNFSFVENTEMFGNKMVEGVYELGSIMKPLTMAAGLDAKAVTAETTYYDEGFLVLDGGNAKISNYDLKGRGRVPMQEVLNQSLNTGATFVVSQMGNKVFADYMRAYGLGEETGIDLPGELRGFLGNLDSPRDVEYATAAFGQGIAVTPIAMVRALATLGNGGRIITPHLVKSVEYDVGVSKKIFYDQGKQVLKPSTSEEITRMLVRVVDEALLGGTVKLDRHTVAAKTGTAQIADKVNGGYYDDRFLHSFFGYFPAYSPRFLVFLFTEEPKGVRYASETLTHPFINIAKSLIAYYEIPPDR